jgi:RNA polymerase-binding transcription factor DksA
MDADLPTPDRVDLDPYEAEAEAIAPDDETTAADTAAPVVRPEPGPADGAANAETPDAEVETTPVHDAPADDALTDAADGRLDLDAIEADLAGVEVALARLSDGTYWTDEATGEPLPDELLAASPTARRA